MLYDRLDAALQGLPSSAEHVAAYLRDRGVSGVRDECTACPLARWLRQELHVPYAYVDTDAVRVIDDQYNAASITAPWTVVAFIASFDHAHEYPELVDVGGLTDEERWDLDYLDNV